MLVGIGLIGTLTATVASYFVQEKATATEERLERIEALLSQLVRNGNGTGAHIDEAVTSAKRVPESIHF